MEYAESLAWLYDLPRYAQSRDLKRVRALLAATAHPERAFTPVHIAGTNGKGSTAATLASLLAAAGARTGLYTSPHLSRFNERIRVDGAPVPDADVARLATRLSAATERVVARDATLAPAGFDAFTVLALMWFRERDVDVAVMEAGIGGRLDATNAFPGAPVTVLTNVSLEHTEVLGDTVTAVAREKLALLKPGGTLVTAATQPEVLALAHEVARRGNNPMRVLGDDFHVRVREARLDGVRFDYEGRAWRLQDLWLPLAGAHQARNAACALAAAEALAEREVAAWSEETLRAGLAATRWPGRLETVARAPLTIVDAGHNPDGVDAAVAALAPLVQDRPRTLVLGVSADKPYAGMVRRILDLAPERVVVTCPRHRGLDVDRLADTLAAAGWKGEVARVPAVGDAIAHARRVTPAEGVVLVLGGLYLAAEAREAAGAAP